MQNVNPTRLSFPSPQGHHHDMGAFPNEWFDPALLYLHLEWSQSNIVFHKDWLIQVSTHQGLCCSHPLLCRAITGWARVFRYSVLSKREALTIAQGVKSLSISLSLITLMILPSIQVPITIGTRWENSNSSGTMRKTTSSS